MRQAKYRSGKFLARLTILICQKRVKNDLLANDVILEDYGGEIPAVPVSALKGVGLVELEETIVAVAEMLDLRGDNTGLSEGVIIESKLDKGKGNVATVLVKRGTLKKGDIIVAGNAWGKVRLMANENGKPMKEATPSMPVEISGWKNLPSAGDIVLAVESEVCIMLMWFARDSMCRASPSKSSNRGSNEPNFLKKPRRLRISIINDKAKKCK